MTAWAQILPRHCMNTSTVVTSTSHLTLISLPMLWMKLSRRYVERSLPKANTYFPACGLHSFTSASESVYCVQRLYTVASPCVPSCTASAFGSLLDLCTCSPQSTELYVGWGTQLRRVCKSGRDPYVRVSIYSRSMFPLQTMGIAHLWTFMLRGRVSRCSDGV